MAVENWVRAEIDAVVEDWLRQRRIFTAYEVSRQVHAGGVKMRHRELRDDVHESLQLAAGRYGYTRTLRDVGGSEAWLYHHWKDNAWSHTPLPREATHSPSSTRYTSNHAALLETAPYDSPLVPATSPAYSSGVAVADLPARRPHVAETPTPAPASRLTRRSDNVTQLELRPDETAVVVCNELETDVIIHNAKATPQGSPLRQEVVTAGQWLMSWVRTILDC